ncbi:hypothetical protein D3C76_1563160 [compost metagenome]
MEFYGLISKCQFAEGHVALVIHRPPHRQFRITLYIIPQAADRVADVILPTESADQLHR